MLCELYIFYLVFILFVKSSESPSDGDFLGSLLHVWYESPPESRLLKLLQRSGKDDGVWGRVGGDDTKGMVNGNEGVQSLGGREISRSIRDGICVCVVVVVVVAVVLVVVVLIVAMEVMGGGGGGVDGSGGNSGESGTCRSGGGSGNVVHRSVGGGLCGSG